MISGASTVRVFFPLLVEEVLMLLFKEADTFYVNCKKLEQILATRSLKYNTLFFFISDLCHSRIESVLMIPCYTPLHSMEGEFHMTGIRDE